MDEGQRERFERFAGVVIPMTDALNRAGTARSQERTHSGVLVWLVADALRKNVNIADIWWALSIDPHLTKSGEAYLGATGKTLFEQALNLSDNETWTKALNKEAGRIRPATQKDRDACRAELEAQAQDDDTVTEDFIDESVEAIEWIKIPDPKGRPSNPNLSAVVRVGREVSGALDNIGGQITVGDEFHKQFEDAIEELSLMDEETVTCVAFVRAVDSRTEHTRGELTALQAMRRQITAPSVDNDFNSMDWATLESPADTRKAFEARDAEEQQDD
jgi:hypothetical protein